MTHSEIARKSITRLNQSSYNAEQGIYTGRNSSFTLGNVAFHFHKALAAIVAIEDAEGVEAAAKLSDRLTAARQRATAARLLSPATVSEIETEVCCPPTEFHLQGVESGYAEVWKGALKWGCVAREKFGSTRTGTQWVAYNLNDRRIGDADTRAQAVRLVIESRRF